MIRPRCLDPDLILPVARLSTEVFHTGQWSDRRPMFRERPSPCRLACPLCNDLPRAMDRLARGDFDVALASFLGESPLPGVLGRVCHRPCERDCNRAEWDGAVSIRAAERGAAEFGRAEPTLLSTSGRGQPVAVVGSGPAGLSAAFHLARLGHPVTVFEAEGEPGGMLRLAIPEHRLPRAVLDRDIERILGLGVEIRCGQRIDQASLEDLLSGHRAVFLALGAGRSADLSVPGVSAQGVVSGLEFLKDAVQGRIKAISGRVTVIGGGNVALDAALTARRLGAEEVVVVCLENLSQMPALPEEIDQAQEEGIFIQPGWGVAEILERGGRARGLKLARCLSLWDDSGRFSPCLDQSETRTLPAELVVTAVGQAPDLAWLEGVSGLTAQGRLVADPITLATARPGLLAGGDSVTGPSSVAQAAAAGKRAAASIHLALNPDAAKSGLPPGPNFSIQALFSGRPQTDPTQAVRFADLDPLFLSFSPFRPLPRLEASRRIGSAEVNLSLDRDETQTQAGQCLSCGACNDCGRCYLFCPDLALAPASPDRAGFKPREEFCKGCGVCATVCPGRVLVMGQGGPAR